MRRLITIMCLLFSIQNLSAEDLEYKMDIGGGLGLSHYFGDANTGTSFMGAFTCRRNFNPRMALKMNLAIGGVKGDTKGMYIPTDPYSQTPEGGVPMKEFSFARTVMDAGAQFELNFWGYGIGPAYKNLSRITPYAIVGIGMTLGMGGGASACAGLNFPVGLGVKYKLKQRLNVGVEWTMRFSTTDKLDVTGSNERLVDPYGIKSGFMKNKDSYSFLMFFVTYDICPKLRKCNN